MRVFRRIEASNQVSEKGTVATIGVFDGVHIGHQTLIKRTVEKSSELSLPSVVFSFDPTPNEYFSKNQSQLRLSSFRQKFNLIKDLGIENLYIPPFETKMEILGPNEFIDLHLLKLLNVKYLIIGDDFQFGKNKSGSIIELERSGKENDFSVEAIRTIELNSKRVSSTIIREALFRNQPEIANQYLGRNYSIEGRVIYGKQIGRTISIPTANVDIKKINNPLRGVFCVNVSIENDNQLYSGVANIGYKPTVDGEALTLEVHILDFNQNIYKSRISIEFLRYLRGEKKFNGINQLKHQINQDIDQARKYFKDLT